MHDKKIMVHKELSTFLLGSKFSIWSSISTRENTCQTETVVNHYKGQLQKTKSDAPHYISSDYLLLR